MSRLLCFFSVLLVIGCTSKSGTSNQLGDNEQKNNDSSSPITNLKLSLGTILEEMEVKFQNLSIVVNQNKIDYIQITVPTGSHSEELLYELFVLIHQKLLQRDIDHSLLNDIVHYKVYTLDNPDYQMDVKLFSDLKQTEFFNEYYISSLKYLYNNVSEIRLVSIEMFIREYGTKTCSLDESQDKILLSFLRNYCLAIEESDSIDCYNYFFALAKGYEVNRSSFHGEEVFSESDLNFFLHLQGSSFDDFDEIHLLEEFGSGPN